MDIFTLGRPTALRPEDRVADACLWVRDNGTTFKRLMRIAHEQVDSGNPCLRRGDVARIATEMGFSVSNVDELRFDNNLWAVLTRLMVMLRPRLARCLHFRKADVDMVDIQAEWRRTVNANTTFLASSWQDAKRLCELGDASAR
jgi:hypothetical protein